MSTSLQSELSVHRAMAQAPAPGGASRFVGLAIAIALNAAVLAVLLHGTPARPPKALATPIVVSLITPETPKPPLPLERPRPKPLAKPEPKPLPQPIQQQPVVQQDIAPVQSQSIYVATSPEPPPRVEVTPTPEPPAPPPVTPPRFNADYLQNPPPPYPRIARQMGERGKVMLRVLVSADGLAERVELKTSSGSQRLDESALETVKHWKFVPARQGDQKVAAWVIVPIVFTIDS